LTDFCVPPKTLLGVSLTNMLGKVEMETAGARVVMLCAASSDGWDRELFLDDFMPEEDLIAGFLHLLGCGWLVSYSGGQGFGVTPEFVSRIERLRHVDVLRRHLVSLEE
jgi:hypothetical protein